MPITYATSTPFLTWLFHLLRDRKTLKVLAANYRSTYAVHGRSKQTADVQEEIIALALGGVYDSNERFKNISPDVFERLLFSLLTSYQGWEWVDDLGAFWNSPPDGVYLDAAVQLRLTELTAPLDEVIAVAQDRFA